MAIKLIANYAKRLGLPGFSSHQFSVSVETELHDVNDIAGESARLYSTLQQSVDGQIRQTGFVPAPGYGMEPPPHGNAADSPNGNGHPANGSAESSSGDWQCTGKQQDLILSIVRENNLNKDEIEMLAVEMFGQGVRSLNRLAASGLIDELFERYPRRNRSNGNGHSNGHGQTSGTRNGYRRSLRPERGGRMSATQAATAPVDVAARIKALTQTVSASRLGLWQSCRLKFFFRQILQIPKPRTAALHVGGCVHETLRQWNKARWRRETLSLKALYEIFVTAWASPGREEPVDWSEPGEEEDQRKTGWRLLETYFRESPITPEEKPEAVEVTAEADLSREGLPGLVGILDLVREGGRIVDFKTSGQTPVPEKAAHQHETQTTVYGMLYREATGRRETAIELHHLVKLKNPRLVITAMDPVSEAQKTRLFQIMESYVRGLEREDFVPSPGIQCSSCEFFSECRAWDGGAR